MRFIHVSSIILAGIVCFVQSAFAETQYLQIGQIHLFLLSDGGSDCRGNEAGFIGTDHCHCRRKPGFGSKCYGSTGAPGEL